MKIAIEQLKMDERTAVIKSALDNGERLGLISSLDGGQLLTLLLSPQTGGARCFTTPVEGGRYRSITPMVPQAHWFERTTWDMFGLYPDGHLRPKRTHLHEPYAQVETPLSRTPSCAVDKHRYEFMSVEGEGVYEIPVGPIHAGIIEPGHFRFSCYGEEIINLEIRLGYVHRGVEKRLTEVQWQKARFVAEAAASDMPVASALAHATALESLMDMEVKRSSLLVRTIALEIERSAMHLSDLGGIAGDIGFLAISSSLARLRGQALRMGELTGGNRFMRALICPGGVTRALGKQALEEIGRTARELRAQFDRIIDFFFDNQVAVDRMEGVGTVSRSLANDFGLVGIAGRAAACRYDCRESFKHGAYPDEYVHVVTELKGDVLARARVRVGEVHASLDLIARLLHEVDDNVLRPDLPTRLPKDGTALGIVESHRGELIHLIHTNEAGAIQRYCIKDASVNNWTALAIAVRNNLVADFPLCNKSFSLSYSGHDL